jgi:capsular polysaccharide biosynthesis protein
VQNLPRAILFLKNYPHGRVALPRGYRTNNFGACLALFGIAPEAVVEIAPNTVYRFETAAFIDHLYDHSGTVHPAAIDILAGATLPDPEEMSPPRFFMDRVTQAVRRNIENIDAAAAVMHRHGFARGRISLAPVAKQAATWQAATHFLSILGSDMTNLVFAKPGSHVISITPDFHNDMFFFDLAAAKGMVWHELLCGEIATRRDPLTHSSFDVRPEALDAVLRAACLI